MKQAFLILILFSWLNSHSQQPCSPGYRYLPSMSTSSLQIIADTCVADSVYKRAVLEFRENMCGEGGHISIGGGYYYARNPKWINDSIGCVTTETFKKMVKGKWVDISRCRYYYENESTECGTWDDSNKYIKIPCCGHIHKTPPE